MRDSLRRAQAKYDRKRRTWDFSVNRDTDADLVEWLERQANVTAYLRDLVRKDMRRKKSRNSNFPY